MVRIKDMEILTLLHTSSRTLLSSFAASANNEKNAVLFDGSVFILKFYIDIKINSLGIFRSNALKILESNPERKIALTLSRDEKTLFILQNVNPLQLSLLPYKRVSNTSLEQQTPLDVVDLPNYSRHISKWSTIAGDKVIIAKSAAFDPHYYPKFGPNLFWFYKKDNFWWPRFPNTIQDHNSEILTVALSKDEETLAFIKNLAIDSESKSEKMNLTLNFINLKGGVSNNILTDLQLPENDCSGQVPSLKFSKNDQLMFYANCDLIIYNVSNPASPLRLSRTASLFVETYGFALSEDEKTLYLAGQNNHDSTDLYIFDISDVCNPKALSNISFDFTTTATTHIVELSSDEEKLFIGFLAAMLIVDVRVPTQPKAFGFSYFTVEDHAPTFVKSNSLFYTASESGVTAFDFSSQYLLYMKESDFKMGGSYSIILNVLKMNNRFQFDYLVKKHKFLKVTLFDFESILLTGRPNKALPDWISFDKERSLITIEPRSISTAKNFTISVTLSTQIQASFFIGLKLISNESEANDLMRNLLQYGYIDYQGYLSENLDLGQKLWLDPKYNEIERDIRAILSQNYIEAVNEILVSTSLDLSETQPFIVSSPSQEIISVTIELNQGGEKKPYFLDKAYSNLKSAIITNGGSVLTLKGLLPNVNKALGEILIDRDQLCVCNGVIFVEDGINRPISRHITNITDYFTTNNESIRISEDNHLAIWSMNPDHLIFEVHLDLKKSLTETQPRFVKEYFFLRHSFSNNQASLYLEGSMKDINDVLKEILIDLGSFETCGGTISVKDDKNPAKSQYIKTLSDHFYINAYPQYNTSFSIQKQIENRPFYTGAYSSIEFDPRTFTDKNGLALEYQLIMSNLKEESWLTLRGLSLIGTPPEQFPPPSYNLTLVVKNEFKSIKIPFTLEIKTSFAFAARMIIKSLGLLSPLLGFLLAMTRIYNILAKRYYQYPRSFKLRVGEEITNDKIFPISFIENEIKQSRIIFDDLVRKNGFGKGDVVEYFLNPETQILDKEKIISTLQGEYMDKVVQQLVVNMIVMKQLASGKEKVTREVFNKIKNKWMDIVTYNSEFVIDSTSLEKELLRLNLGASANDETNLSVGLITSNEEDKINMDLLQNAILAHASSFQSLNMNTIDIDVSSSKKVIKGNSCWNCIRETLLLNLKAFVFLNKRELGYGIEYQIKGNILHFYGKLTDDLKDDTIVIHIKDKRGRILREIGVVEGNIDIIKHPHHHTLVENVSEQL